MYVSKLQYNATQVYVLFTNCSETFFKYDFWRFANVALVLMLLLLPLRVAALLLRLLLSFHVFMLRMSWLHGDDHDNGDNNSGGDEDE